MIYTIYKPILIKIDAVKQFFLIIQYTRRSNFYLGQRYLFNRHTFWKTSHCYLLFTWSDGAKKKIYLGSNEATD